MTGMKEGAGEDPFAEDPQETEPQKSREQQSDHGELSPPAKSSSPDREQSQQMQIPYKFRRDGVQDGRDRVPLFLHEETKNSEREAQRELENRFDDDVSLTDLREAVMKVGLQHIDEVQIQLEDWGYGLTFDD